MSVRAGRLSTGAVTVTVAVAVGRRPTVGREIRDVVRADDVVGLASVVVSGRGGGGVILGPWRRRRHRCDCGCCGRRVGGAAAAAASGAMSDDGDA